MARPEIWAGQKARGGSIAAGLCDRRATQWAAQRSAVSIAKSLSHFFFFFVNAAAGICEMASSQGQGPWYSAVCKCVLTGRRNNSEGIAAFSPALDRFPEVLRRVNSALANDPGVVRQK